MIFTPLINREGIFIFAFKPNNTIMTISIKQDNVTIAVELEEDDWDKTPSCEDAMLAAFDALRRVFPIESVTRAYYRINPESLGLRGKDDPVRMMYEK